MNKLGTELLQVFEETKKPLSERINQIDTNTSLETQWEAIENIIEEVANIDSEVEKERYIKLLSEKTGTDKRSIKKELKKYAIHAGIEQTENLVVAHPSYEVNESFISLGFKETVIIDNKPQQRNIYLVETPEGFKVLNSPVIDMGGKKVIFDERERVLVTLNDRWRRDRLQAFINGPQQVTGIYEEIRDTIKLFIDFQNDATYGLVTAWIIGTYFHRCFHAFPFLFLYGKKQCGKSRTLDLLERLSFNAMKIKGVSVPSMTDSIDGIRGTFIMDQAEALSQKQNVELLGILADSYTPGGGKRRVVNIANKRRALLEFETYSPKAFASIKEIDADLKDRCIEIIMIRAEKEHPYPEPFLPVWADLRDKLYRLLLTKWREVMDIYQTAGQGMINRVRELWRPIDTILILEDVPDGEREGIQRAFLESMAETQTGLSELEDKLIQTLLDLLKETGEATLSVQDILKEMNIPEGERFKKADQSRWIGKTINRLYLATEQLPREGNKRRYRFTTDHIQNIFNRYQINGFNGVMAYSNTEAILQTANEKQGNGAMAQVTAQPTVTPIHANTQKSNGVAQTVDSSHSRQYANNAVDLSENEFNFIPHIYTGSGKASMICSDSLDVMADCGDKPVPYGDCQEFKMKLFSLQKGMEPFCVKKGAWCHVAKEN